jgi:uncharacterized Fe-S center protein
VADSIVLMAELTPDSGGEERSKATKRLLDAGGLDSRVRERDRVAVKVHVGELHNDSHVAPEICAVITERIRALGGLPFLTETSTLYRGQRSNAVDHLRHAFAHGFTFEKVGAPFIMADGLTGSSEIEVPIPGVLFRAVKIAREVVLAESLIAVSHATGHMASGLGACIKNLGMGLASRMGKLRQHSSVSPTIDAAACTFCELCIKWCPADAIVEQEGKAFILKDRCIGCGQCFTVCNFEAVRHNWGVASADLQKRMAEHALGAVTGKEQRVYFLNYLTDMTADCDCLSRRQTPVLPDVGILASEDPVALDQATLDITKEKCGRDLSRASYPKIDPAVQLEHGERIGLGSRKYRLQRV